MSKKLFNCLWEKPDLNVYKLALKYIKTSESKYCCYAICNAIHTLYPKFSCQDAYILEDMYTEQFRRVTYQYELGAPWWWSSSDICKDERIFALKHFIKVCIKEGKQQNK